MLNSIKYFEEECINRFEELENEFLRNPTKIAEYTIGITNELHKLGLVMIKESLELMDQMLQKSPIRKKNWLVEAHSTKQLITSLGTVTFKKTLFTNRNTKESEYLLDRIMGLEKHERMTEDAEAKMLEEAVQTSYRRGGEEISLESEVSKQTVKNKIHMLKFPKNEEKPEEKKVLDYLYIDADEDHVSLQFWDKKGDLAENEKQQKNNCLITKLVYVYEGIAPESPKSKRHKLVNPYYFGRVCSGEENLKFWDEIYEYIDNHYDLSRVKKVYVNGDGGNWIKAGMRRIEGITYVLDGFHLEKYLTKLTSHMLDSKEDAKDELRKLIRYSSKEKFSEKVEEIKSYSSSEVGRERIEGSKKYILDNWMAARTRLRHDEGVKGCSAEGHISHALSSRMSSRPLGWSVVGASKMAELRAYYLNGGDMLELVRYQKQELPKVAGAEKDILRCHEVVWSEISRHGELGKYMDAITHSMSFDVRKKAWFNGHIWGL